MTWNRHSIYIYVELCIPNNPVLLSKLVYSFKEKKPTIFIKWREVYLFLESNSSWYAMHPVGPSWLTRGQISQNNYRFTSKHQKYKFSTWGHCNCLNGGIQNMTFQFWCTLCQNEGQICLCTNAVFGVFLRTFGHLIRRFVLIL